MDIIANWLAGLPAMPTEDEYGRPWAMIYRSGFTPAQARFFAEIARREQNAPAQEIAPAQASAGMIYRNGIVDDTHLYFMQAGRLARRDLGAVDHVGDLLQICLETGLEAIWTLAGTKLSDRATRAFIEDSRAAQVWEISNAQFTPDATQTDAQGRATYLKAYKKKEARGRRVPGQDQGRAVYLGWAEHSYSYNFDDVTSPVTLLGALSFLEDALGVPARYSAHTTGKNLMKAENSNATRAPWIAPVNLAVFMPVIATPGQDIVWMRDLTAQEREPGGYLVTADKNSMYAGACTSVQLGQGEPVYKRGAEIDLNKLEIGIYHIRIAGESIFDGKQLPHPTGGELQSWQWVYTVKLLLDLGYEVTIEEGYTWARAHTTLRTWADRLWKSRISLKSNHPDCKRERYANEQARRLAYNAMQTVIRGAIGLLAHYPDFPGRAGAFDWYRPDWNALIVDHARVKMFYLMRKYAEMGYIPFAILTDCLYFIGSTDNHAQALPGLFARSNDLGGFKRKFDRPVTSGQIATLQARKGYTINEVNGALLKFDRGEIEIAA